MPTGSALVVTDVVLLNPTSGFVNIELSSDDHATDVRLSETQHFSAGLVFPSGSRVNITGVTSGGTAVDLIGYLVKRG